MVYVTRRETFSASHRLYNPAWTDAQNEAVFDKCNSIHGHGHNYVIEVTVAGEPDPQTGYVLDLKLLKQIIKREFVDKVDHKHLNLDVEWFRSTIPTAENIARIAWDVLRPKIPSGALYQIRLHETENNIVEYRGA